MSEMDDFGFDDDPVREDSRRPSSSGAEPGEPTRRQMTALTSLADGSLRSADTRTEVEDDPALHALLDEQRRAVALVRGAADDVRAPDALRERLQALAPQAGVEPGRARPARRRGARAPSLRGRRLLAGVAAAAAVLVIALVLSLQGSSATPTVQQTAALATRPATLPAPRHTTSSSYLVDRSEAGVAFPCWEEHFHWRTAGARTDTLQGRAVTTVFYADRRGRTVAYAIVSGPALPAPKGARAVVHNGVPLLVLTTAQGTVVTWQRNGHSCVLAATGVPTTTLVRLASWQAHGAIAA